jgi:glutamate-1-semialdehyde 2,1-aminomutase
MTRNHAPLLADLAAAYERHAPQSAALNERALHHLIDGGSHSVRLKEPFPPRIVAARGGWLQDEDGHHILDFWQGHLANILGHNPEVVTSVLADAFQNRYGLQSGMTDRLQIEAAEIICRQTGQERVRFTTSGSLATMYAMMLARAFTERDLVMKVGGGWHGAQPWGLKGVRYKTGDNGGYQHIESAGLPATVTDEVLITGYNDPDQLREQFAKYGDRIACFLVEPFIGGGGLIPATPEFLKTAREMTHQYGALLIHDEVISGFRFRAGDVSALYGVKPDLLTLGKIIGGGMPVAAVAGRTDIMELAGQAGGNRVKFFGGTYSGHTSSFIAANAMLAHLVQHEKEIYPALSESGERMRQIVVAAFREEGIYACCTGGGNEVLPGSSLWMVHFPHREDVKLDKPENVYNPAVCDTVLNHQVMDLGLLLENVYVMGGHGAISTTHTEKDLEVFDQACRSLAHRVRQSLK